MSQQTLEGVRLTTEIAERGYAEFEHGIPKDMIETLVSHYADFTLRHPDPLPSTMDAMLPATDAVPDISKGLDTLDRSADQQQEWHKYRTNAPQIGKPDGYTNRSFQEHALKQSRGLIIPSEDPKEFYHHTPGHYAAIARNHIEFGWGSIPQEVGILNIAFAGIHQRASELIIKVCGLIEETHPEIRQFITRESLLTSPVRLLFYHPTTNQTLGAGHYDKSMLTLQIGESHEGLRVAPNAASDLTPVVRSSEKAVFFPGNSVEDRFPDTPYQAGWHDIISINRLNEGRAVPSKAIEVCARWALIFFANPVGFVQPDKSATHTRFS